MPTYLQDAQRTIRQVLTSPVMGGVVVHGTYRRITPPTPTASAMTVENPVHILLSDLSNTGPLPETWKPTDRIAQIQQCELAALGAPVEKDQLIIGARTYQVMRGWEESPGLFWHMQVRC